MALCQLPAEPECQTYLLRDLFQRLLSNLPIEGEWQLNILQNSTGNTYICTKLQQNSRYQRISGSYLCSLIEDHFLSSVSFQYEETVVSFIANNSNNACDAVRQEHLTELTRLVAYSGGISDLFSDISQAPYYYRQAGIALEMGRQKCPEQDFFYFKDFALSYMLSNSQEKFPLQMLLTSGLQNLIDHDKASDANYVQTLRVYLNNNMSLVKTSTDLFVHRTTLIARLKRIQTLLQTDSESPTERLYIQLLLKLLEM